MLLQTSRKGDSEWYKHRKQQPFRGSLSIDFIMITSDLARHHPRQWIVGIMWEVRHARMTPGQRLGLPGLRDHLSTSYPRRAVQILLRQMRFG